MKIILFSVPDDERMLKRAGEAIDNFKDMVFPSGYEPGSKKRVTSEFLACSSVDIFMKYTSESKPTIFPKSWFSINDNFIKIFDF